MTTRGENQTTIVACLISYMDTYDGKVLTLNNWGQLYIISRRKKMQPTGTTLQVKDIFLLMDSYSRLVHFFDVLNEWIASGVSNDDFCSEEVLA